MTGAVFLSYASQDADAAHTMAETLRSAGVEVWFDKSELPRWRRVGRSDRTADQSLRGIYPDHLAEHPRFEKEGYFRLFSGKLAVDRSHLTSSKAFLLPVVVDDLEDDDRVPESSARFSGRGCLPEKHRLPSSSEF